MTSSLSSRTIMSVAPMLERDFQTADQTCPFGNIVCRYAEKLSDFAQHAAAVASVITAPQAAGPGLPREPPSAYSVSVRELPSAGVVTNLSHSLLGRCTYHYASRRGWPIETRVAVTSCEQLDGSRYAFGTKRCKFDFPIDANGMRCQRRPRT